jgi:iron complex transport system substrate-binding protein
MKRFAMHSVSSRRSAAAVAGVVAIAVSMLGSCGGSSDASPPDQKSPADTYPVTVTNCGVPVTFTKAPDRAVSNDVNTTEDMLALGLQSHMVGDFGVNGDAPEGSPPVPGRFLSAFKKVRDVSPDYFNLEELVGLHPDFLFAGWNYGLEMGTNLTPGYLAKFGIKTLALTESCAHVQSEQRVSIEDTYQDITNLGEIFGVEKRAEALIASMRAQIASVHAKVAGLAPVRVFDYDSGEAAPFTGPGLATPTAEISLGGGVNIFGNLKQSWTTVSWEQVVKADPQCIIINDYGTPTAAQKEQFLESDSITKGLTAVRNRCFLPLAYDEVTPGPLDSDAVVGIARWLHPSAFGQPADGSNILSPGSASVRPV